MSVLRSLLRTSEEATFSEQIDETILLISEVAEKVALEPKTIRFYEKAGLLKPRRLGQLRIFTKSDIEILILVKQLREYGMPIVRIREVLSLRLKPCNDGNLQLKSILVDQLETLLLKRDLLTEQIALLDSTLSVSGERYAA
jgi:DNA-binding transcriptional MerR regulator